MKQMCVPSCHFSFFSLHFISFFLGCPLPVPKRTLHPSNLIPLITSLDLALENGWKVGEEPKQESQPLIAVFVWRKKCVFLTGWVFLALELFLLQLNSGGKCEK